MLAWKAINPHTLTSFRGKEDPWRLNYTKVYDGETSMCIAGYHGSYSATDALFYVPTSYYYNSDTPPLLLRAAIRKNWYYAEEHDHWFRRDKFVCNRMRPLFHLNIVEIVKPYVSDEGLHLEAFYTLLEDSTEFCFEIEEQIYALYEETYPDFYALEEKHGTL